jgi:hypothetical protein
MRWVRRGVISLVAVFALIQLVPYGRDHSNPRVIAAAPWPSEDARRLARAACYDCHSNETKWPWYTNIAPMSWLVQHDVDEGRDKLNFSEWPPGEDELAEPVQEGEMPPANYLRLHSDAKLSPAEKTRLVEALRQLENEPQLRRGRRAGGP